MVERADPIRPGYAMQVHSSTYPVSLFDNTPEEDYPVGAVRSDSPPIYGREDATWQAAFP